MAAESGQFVGMNGHTYQVVLSGTGVTAEPLIFVGESPVVISMAAGERKFVGFKSQTAKVKIVTDHPMLELYGNSATSVTLVIADTTSQSILFSGYVVPFAYSQPYSGINDVIEIEAVDSITARKEIAYTNFGTPHGTDRSGLAIVQELCRRAGISRIVEHINFSTVAFTGESPLNVPVAQAGFLQDEVSEVDVMAAICKFFGLTAHVFGDTLYLYDEHYLTHSESARATDVNIYLYNGTWNKSQTYHERDNSPLASQGIYVGDGILSGVTINVERAYDGVQITPEGADTSILLPDVCADENLEENDNNLGTSRRVYGDTDYTQYRTPLKSKLMRFGKTEGSVIVDFPATSGDWMKPDANAGTNWLEGAIPMGYVQVSKTYINDDNLEVERQEAQRANMVWMRAATDAAFVGKQYAEKSYSHTDGYVELYIAYRRTNRSNWQKPEGDNLLTDESRIKFLQLNIGGKYLVKDGRVEGWGDTIDAPMYVKDNKLRPTDEGIARYDNRFVVSVPNNGQVHAELRGRGSSSVASDYYIESLRIEAVGDKVNDAHMDMRHEYTDKPSEYLEAKTMLTTRKSGATGYINENGLRNYGKNARPSVVPATNWVGGYMARSSEESIPISGILMEQLRERYGEPHTAYTMTVGKMLYPYKMTTYEGKRYTIESYDLDIYNTETTVTIN